MTRLPLPEYNPDDLPNQQGRQARPGFICSQISKAIVSDIYVIHWQAVYGPLDIGCGLRIRPGDLRWMLQYQMVREIVDNGEIIAHGPDNLIYLASIGGKLWRAVIKAAQKRAEFFMTTFHYIEKSHGRRALKSGKLVRGDK